MAGHDARTQSLRHDEDLHLFGESVDAVDDILKFYGVRIEKALNPLLVKDFGKISRRFAKALKDVTGGVEKEAMRGALNMLDVDWPGLSPKAQGRVVDAAQNRLRKVLVEKVPPAIKKRVRLTAENVVTITKAKVKVRYDINIGSTFTQLDNDIVSLLTKSHANFVTDEMGKRSIAFGKKVSTIAGRGLERGASAQEIMRDIRKIDSIDKLGRKAFYWEVVASSFVNRARTSAQISSFSQAGISIYLWESVMDEVTTESCRYLDGKRFSVGAAVKRIQQAESKAAQSPQSVKAVQPWVRTGRDAEGNKIIYYKEENGERSTVAQITESAVGRADEVGGFSGGLSADVLQDRGISMPPIHGLCRSTVVPDVGAIQSPVQTAPAAPYSPKPKPKPKSKIKPKPVPNVAPPPVTVPPAPVQATPPTPIELAQAKALKLPEFDGIPDGVHIPFDDKFDPSAPWLSKFNSFTKEQKKPFTDIGHQVDIGKVFTSKKWVKQADLMKIIQNEDAGFTPQVVKFKGNFYLASGHTEMTANKLLGRKLMPMNITDLDKMTAPKPAPPPPPKPKPKKPTGGAKPTRTKPLNVDDIPEGEFPEQLTELDRDLQSERISSLGRKEKSAIREFTGNGYGDIRQAQYLSEEAARKELGEGFSRAIRRGKEVESGLKKAVPSPGVVYRGIHDIDRDLIDKFLENPTFKLGATSSTSRATRVAKGSNFLGGNFDDSDPGIYKVLFQLDQKSGIGVESLSQVSAELEILISKDTEFEIISVTRSEGTKRVIIIHAKEVEKKKRKPRKSKTTTT